MAAQAGFEFDLEHCPNCGGELKIIAAILEAPVIEKIPTHWDGSPVHRPENQPVARRWKWPEDKSTTVDQAS